MSLNMNSVVDYNDQTFTSKKYESHFLFLKSVYFYGHFIPGKKYVLYYE